MRLKTFSEMEDEELAVALSEEAQIDSWALILAGLRGVEPPAFERLARKALALAPTTLWRYPDLLASVEDRIDEIWREAREATA